MRLIELTQVSNGRKVFISPMQITVVVQGPSHTVVGYCGLRKATTPQKEKGSLEECFLKVSESADVVKKRFEEATA